MNRPSYFNQNLNESNNEFTQNSSNPIYNIEPKPYKCMIKRVEDNQEKEALIIYFDIVEGDLAQCFTNDALNNGGKWNRKGTIWQSYKEENKEMFEGFITAVRKSNVNFVWDWNEKKLIGKNMVVVYGEEEFQTQDTNEIKVSIKPRIIRSIEALNKGEIKPVTRKTLSKKTYGNRNYQTNNNYQPNNNYSNNYNQKPTNYTQPQVPTDIEIDDNDLPF